MAYKKGESGNIAKQYKPGQTGNPNGRPRRLLSTINEELKQKGFERVTASQISEGFELFFNLPEEEIKAFITDKECPMFLRIVGKEMLNKNAREMLERMLDRAHGKGKQTIDGTINMSSKQVFKIGNTEITF